MLLHAVDDGQRSEGGGLDVGAVNFMGLGVQGLAEQQAGELDIGEDGAVAVVPVERQQTGGTGWLVFHFCLHGHELGSGIRAVAIRHQIVHQPEEDIADGRLARLDAHHARHRPMSRPDHRGRAHHRHRYRPR